MPDAMHADVEYEDDWLPKDFKPMKFREMLWMKVKNAPLVGVGCVGVAISFGMAGYWYRLGNPKKFNYWLRWRVGTQFFTIGAMVYYGGVAFTREQQNQNYKKQMVLLGDLPADTPMPKVSNNPFASRDESSRWRDAVMSPSTPEAASSSSSSSSGSRSGGATTMEPEMLTEEEVEVRQHYPRPVGDRIRVSDFRAKLQERALSAAQATEENSVAQRERNAFEQRMREAEKAQAEEDEARARGELRGVHGATGQGKMLIQRLEANSARQKGKKEEQRDV